MRLSKAVTQLRRRLEFLKGRLERGNLSGGADWDKSEIAALEAVLRHLERRGDLENDPKENSP